jgi:protein-tyrosine-phosphatase
MLHARVPTSTVASVGTGRYPGPATAETRAAAASLGLDLDEHSSYQLDPGSIARSRLILTMERAHVREVVVLDRRAFPRTFTLREIVRRADAVGPRGQDVTLEDWAALIGQGRTPKDLLPGGSDDDVADPVGRSQKRHNETAAQLSALVERFAALAFPES